MTQQTKVDNFVKQIMDIQVTRMGGASAGIFGQAGADVDITNNLKRTVIAFAKESQNTKPDKNALTQYSEEIEGQLQSLVLTNTLSQKEADELVNKLHTLI